MEPPRCLGAGDNERPKYDCVCKLDDFLSGDLGQGHHQSGPQMELSLVPAWQPANAQFSGVNTQLNQLPRLYFRMITELTEKWYTECVYNVLVRINTCES
jgi:hypothetical protein